MEIVKIENNSKFGLVVSSRVIAERLGKRHSDVLEGLDFLIKSSTAEISALFIKDSYVAKNGKRNRQYLLTKDGFTLYMFNIQGYLDFKIAYINKFNEMEQMLKQPQQVQIKLPKPYELVKKYYNGIPVMSILDLEYVFKIDRYSLHAYIKKFNISGIFLQGDELRKFKRFNPSVLSNISCMYVFDSDAADELSKALKMTDKQKDLVGYFGVPTTKIIPKETMYIALTQIELLLKMAKDVKDPLRKEYLLSSATNLLIKIGLWNKTCKGYSGISDEWDINSLEGWNKKAALLNANHLMRFDNLVN